MTARARLIGGPRDGAVYDVPAEPTPPLQINVADMPRTLITRLVGGEEIAMTEPAYEVHVYLRQTDPPPDGAPWCYYWQGSGARS